VNNHGGFGRWFFLEVTDPWDAGNLIEATLGAIDDTPSFEPVTER